MTPIEVYSLVSEPNYRGVSTSVGTVTLETYRPDPRRYQSNSANSEPIYTVTVHIDGNPIPWTFYDEREAVDFACDRLRWLLNSADGSQGMVGDNGPVY